MSYNPHLIRDKLLRVATFVKRIYFDFCGAFFVAIIFVSSLMILVIYLSIAFKVASLALEHECASAS